MAGLYTRWMLRPLAVLPPLLVALALASPASAAPPAPFGHPCTPQNGALFCPTNDLADRVPSWDGTPIDVDVTLPPTGDGPFPTIVIEHGFPGSKSSYQTTTPEGSGAGTANYNNLFYAQRGWAVVNASARGFGRSCGVEESRTPDCSKGYVRIADHRYEVRDIQHLLGLLVDQGVARPDALAITGVSGGGGRSIAAAFLRDRVRTPDGLYAPWTSPNGTPLAYKAVFARWGWNDLASALMPNGRLRDLRVPRTFASRTPIGILKESWINGLLFSAQVVGANLAPQGADAEADILGWRDVLLRGEPYRSDARRILDTATAYVGGAAGITGSTAAPLLLSNGWNDDLFPVDEVLRVYKRLRAADPAAPVYLALGDFGHSRAGNPIDPVRASHEIGLGFLNKHVLGQPFAVPAGGASAWLTACPKGTAGRLLTAASFEELQNGRRRFGSRRNRRISNRAGNVAVADRLSNPQLSDPCERFSARRERRTAEYRFKKVRRTFTLIGSPYVRVKVRAKGRNGQVAARLWLQRGSKQRLVSRGVYRLRRNQRGWVRLQLHPQGMEIPRRSRLKLQLLGRDPGYARPSNGRFSVKIKRVKLTLPSNEK